MAVLLLTLAVVLCSIAVYGEVANYFGGDLNDAQRGPRRHCRIGIRLWLVRRPESVSCFCCGMAASVGWDKRKRSPTI